MINFSMNAKAQSSSHNLSNLQQEFDNLFETPLVPRMSRQPSLHIRSRASSEVPPDHDEDFTAINSLIHQRVSESSCSIPNPFFKDMNSLQPLEISEIPSHVSSSTQMSSNGSHIRNNVNNSNLHNPKIEQQKSKEETNFILPEGDSWPEGWVNLLKSFQRGDVLTQTHQHTPLYRFPVGPRHDFGWPVYYEPYTERRVIQEFRPNTTTIEVDRAEKEDKSLEKNPYYKLKSKKELEEERKNKERMNQQESVIVKQQTIVNSKPQDKSSKNVGEYSSVQNRENDMKTMTRRESAHSNVTLQKDKVVPSKIVEEKPAVKKDLASQKESTPVNGNYKQQDTKKIGEEKEIVRIGEYNNKKNVVENSVKMETPRKEEEKTPKKSEEPKKQQQDINKDKTKVTPKETQTKTTKVEKEVIVAKVEPPKSTEKKTKSEEVVVTTVKNTQKDKKSEKQPVKEEKPIVKEVKPIEIKQEKENKPEIQAQPVSKAKEVVESPREEKEAEPQVQEEFIVLKKKSSYNYFDLNLTFYLEKKGKNKDNEDKAESKKQTLAEKVRKETESLVQNQFAALQAMNAQATQGAKEIKDYSVSKEEKDDAEVLSTGEKIQETKETTTGKSKKKNKKNKKKADEKVENVVKEEEKIKEVDKKTQEQEAKVSTKQQIVIESEKKKEEKASPEKTLNAETKNKESQPKTVIIEQSKVEDEKVEKGIGLDARNVIPDQEVKEVSKSKKKKNKKKKNKEKENENDTSKTTIVAGGLDSQEANKGENKKDNKKSQKNNENEGSTEDDDAGNEGIKQEYQFSKSKKKKLKKRAKQQTLAECLENADLKLAELRSEYFIESSILLEDPMILDKFRKLLEFQKEMADEVKGTIVAEAFRERGPFGEPKIKFQVTLKQSSEDMIEDSEERKKKKKKTIKNVFTEFTESTSADFDSLQKILSEDIENIQLNDSDILDPKEVKLYLIVILIINRIWRA